MYEKILVVDDDYGTIKLIETYLKQDKYQVSIFENPHDALDHFKKEKFDLIISDYLMPQMNGRDFLNKIRAVNQDIPFIIISVMSDIKIVIEVLKQGADDYILKPISKESLLFQIQKNLDDKKNKKITERILKEKEILEFEKKKLVNWRMLYASKDIKQTKNLIDLINRNLNQGGGYIWLQLLKNNIKKIDDKSFQINKSLVDMIIKTTEENKKFFDSVTYLAQLENLAIKSEDMTFDSLINHVYQFLDSEIVKVVEKNKREFSYYNSNINVDSELTIDIGLLKKILNEVIVNAIKYSPKDTEIIFGYDKSRDQNNQYLNLFVKNIARELNSKDKDGHKIRGIPYEYSELIFDLFYTIESFPNYLEDEEWVNGTGLYTCRTILKRQGGWIYTSNEIDYTKDFPKSMVKFTILIPLNDTEPY